jgi:hypothetical protein
MKLVAVYSDVERFRRAVADLRSFRPEEALSPYMVEELLPSSPMDFVKSAGFIGMLTGLSGAFVMEYYSSVIDAPLNVGGRPMNSWPAFLPVEFVLTVLGTALAAFVGFFWRNRLPWPHHPAFAAIDLGRDEFYLLFTKPVSVPEAEALDQALVQSGAARIEEVPE